MKLTVVTATRTGPPSLDETVGSVSGVVPAARHLVVAPSALRPEMARRFPHTEFCAETVHGLYAALNEGFRCAGSWKLGTCLNDDDLLVPEGIPMALAALEDPGVDVVFGRVGLIDERGLRLGAVPVARSADDLIDLLARGIMPLAQPGTIFRREVWKDLGGFDESYRSAGDLDFFVRALLGGKRFRFIDAHVADFRLRAGQLSKDEALAASEAARALAPLAGRKGSLAALARFRVANLGVYLGRVLRHGPVRMRTLYRNTE